MEKRARTERIMSNNNDRISELPEHIIHKILSLLPPEEAIATTLLSSAWRNVWINLPCLNLGKELFNNNQQLQKKLAAFPGYNNANIRRKLRENLKKQFLDFVEKTIQRRSKQAYSVQGLHLYIPNSQMITQETYARLVTWINIAINSFRVEELNVYIDCALGTKCPEKVFVGSLLLKRLSLGRVELASEILVCLGTCCPLLEKLCLDQCIILDTVEVFSFSKLVELVLHGNKFSSKLVIKTPNLGSLDYVGKVSRVFHELSYFPVEVKSCVSLRYLRIYRAICFWSPQLCALVSSVEELVLEDCRFKGDFVVTSNYLKSLCIWNCRAERRNEIKNVEIDAPNLKYLKCNGSFAKSFAINYSKMEIASVHRLASLGDLVYFLSKLLKFNPCKNLEVNLGYCPSSRCLIIPPCLRMGATDGLLYHVKHLVLKISYQVFFWESYCVHVCVDSLLWLSSHPETISISLVKRCSNVEDAQKVLKFKYFKQGEDGAKKCSRCRSLPVLCWQHHLQEVSIENRKGQDAKTKSYQKRSKARAEDDQKIKAFFENVREGEKIVVNII